MSDPKPQRRVPVNQPAVLATKKYLVRLWEIDRKKGATPAQIRGFEVEANAIHKARDLVRFELMNTRRRVVRSVSMTTDGVFTAVVFKNEVRTEQPTKPNEWPLRRDSAAQRASIAETHAARRAAVRERADAAVVDLAEARTKRNEERRAKIAESRKKQGALRAAANEKRAREAAAALEPAKAKAEG